MLDYLKNYLPKQGLIGWGAGVCRRVCVLCCFFTALIVVVSGNASPVTIETPATSSGTPLSRSVFSETGEVLLLEKQKKMQVGVKMWRTTHGGVPVYFVEKTALPIVDAQVIIDAGSARDAAFPGVAYLTASLLSTGAAHYSEERIATLLDQYGMQYQYHVDRDATVLSLRVLSDVQALKTGLTVLHALLSAPQFPVPPFRRRVAQMQQLHKQASQDPGTQLTMHFYRVLYGQHPYGHPVIGNSEQDVQRLTLTAVKGFYRRYYHAHNMRIVLVGDMREAQARAWADALVDKVSNSQPAAPTIPPATSDMHPASVGASRVLHYAFPSQQSNIRVGQVGISRYHPGYFPFILGNHILGSPLTSRLFEQVRNQRGLAYSVYSQLGRWKANGAFWVGMQTRHAKADQARQAVYQTLKRFIRRGPTHPELKQAKQQMIGNFLIGMSTNAGVASQVGMLALWDLPLDYLDNVPIYLNAVTQNQVKTVFRQQLDMKKMLTVVVGG